MIEIGRVQEARWFWLSSGPPDVILNGEPQFTVRKEKHFVICIVWKEKAAKRGNILLQEEEQKFNMFLDIDKRSKLYHKKSS